MSRKIERREYATPLFVRVHQPPAWVHFAACLGTSGASAPTIRPRKQPKALSLALSKTPGTFSQTMTSAGFPAARRRASIASASSKNSRARFERSSLSDLRRPARAGALAWRAADQDVDLGDELGRPISPLGQIAQVRDVQGGARPIADTLRCRFQRQKRNARRADSRRARAASIPPELEPKTKLN